MRIEYEGATYHLMCRGDRREAIFEDDADREVFLATLAQSIRRSGWRLHGYVLMGNHYHLLLETPQANLVRGMTWLQTTYTTRYNARHRTHGHVFGGRYKAVAIDPEEGGYFATVLNYVHLNPARAGLAGRADRPALQDYPWSSLHGYVFPGKRPQWLTVERGFSCLGLRDAPAGRREYLEELSIRIEKDHAEEPDGASAKSLRPALNRGWYFGGEGFRDWLLQKNEALLDRRKSAGQNYHGPEMSDHNSRRAREILEAAVRKAGVELPTLKQRSKSDPLKAEIAVAIRKETTVPLRWLAEELNMGSAMNVSRLTAFALKG